MFSSVDTRALGCVLCRPGWYGNTPSDVTSGERSLALDCETCVLVQEATSLLHNRIEEDTGYRQHSARAPRFPLDLGSEPALLERSRSLRSERSSNADSIQLCSLKSTGTICCAAFS